MKKTIFILMSMLFMLPFMAQAEEYETYRVVSGDSMWKIAVRHEIGVSEIIEANPQVSNPDLIYPGQKLNIPVIDAEKHMEHEVVQLVNEQRARNGLSTLRPDWEVSRVARYKSRDMAEDRYFSHTSPTYGSPFTMLSDFGVRYNSAAENIAQGQRSPEAVMQSWMNSPGHRQNILNANYTHIGVGYHADGHYWTQVFIGR